MECLFPTPQPAMGFETGRCLFLSASPFPVWVECEQAWAHAQRWYRRPCFQPGAHSALGSEHAQQWHCCPRSSPYVLRRFLLLWTFLLRHLFWQRSC